MPLMLASVIDASEAELAPPASRSCAKPRRDVSSTLVPRSGEGASRRTLRGQRCIGAQWIVLRGRCAAPQDEVSWRTVKSRPLPTGRGARIRRPPPETARDHVADDGADVSPLRDRIVGPGVIARDRQRPASLLGAQRLQELCGIVDIALGIEHLAERREVGAMPVMVDLHAADIDELGSLRFRPGETRHRLGERGRMNVPAVDVHVIRAELPFPAGLCQPDRIKDVERDAVQRRRARHLALAHERPLRARGRCARNCDCEQSPAETNSYRPSSIARFRLVSIGVPRPSSRRWRRLHFRSHSHRRSRPSA